MEGWRRRLQRKIDCWNFRGLLGLRCLPSALVRINSREQAEDEKEEEEYFELITVHSVLTHEAGPTPGIFQTDWTLYGISSGNPGEAQKKQQHHWIYSRTT
ncbi:hypothetical protein UPYG_G00013590 [Umbra pygmaea]|uniref:Uncharacterized protein n=1 Tax=Umbra pygmaea TaxID=75934 RepID=A0ABD0XJ47_UMBPY